MRPPIMAGVVGPLQQHSAEIAAAQRNHEKKRDAAEGMAWMPKHEPCLAVPTDGWPTCWLPYGHSGKHSWQTPKDPTDCPRCSKDSCDGSCPR